MFSRVRSASVLGIDAALIEVETDLDFQLPAFRIVGLAEGAVVESKERVTAALKNSGFTLPQKRITINLAPADIRKEGTAFDLPVAIGILAAEGSLPVGSRAETVLIGELALDGALRPVPGVLPIALAARAAGMPGIMVPRANAGEAALVDGIAVFPVATLREAVDHLSGRVPIEPCRETDAGSLERPAAFRNDFSDVRGQGQVKRALEVAAAGGHNLLMIGPPGSGKTMLARRLPTILPDMTREEALETTKIHSVAGLLQDGVYLVDNRPFRAPHHTITDAALIGGGYTPRPGEVSLAHNGVLFIDEMPELGRKSIEGLRQPLEDGSVSVSRASYTVNYPARFMLVAAMNPCPCGYMTDPGRACTCSPIAVQRYHARLSGPILDRIDIHIEVPAVGYQELAGGDGGESSAAIRERVNRARRIQQDRYHDRLGIHSNAHLAPPATDVFCGLDDEGERLLRRAVETFGFSARAYHRILKVARTIADLDGERVIRSPHLAEAVQYRTLDRHIGLS